MKFALLCACVVLAACSRTRESGPTDHAPKRVNPYTFVGVYVDQQTGCQYLMSAHSGITPRLSSDGKTVMCAR